MLVEIQDISQNNVIKGAHLAKACRSSGKTEKSQGKETHAGWKDGRNGPKKCSLHTKLSGKHPFSQNSR
jgi:hypothetical protein